MTLWRLEWLRLIRTKRWMALLAVYVLFGLIGPLTARYLADIVTFAGGDLQGATIDFPPPRPADGMIQYASNATQIGTLVSVVVAAGALAFDVIKQMGVFLRTRVMSVSRILAPRVAVTYLAVAGAYTLGVLVAWYETWALIGPVDAGAVLWGTFLGVAFLAFVVSLVAAVAGRASTLLGTVMFSIVVLLIMPVVGIVEAAGRWLPTHLSGALGSLAAGTTAPSDYFGALAVTAVSCVGLLWLAVQLARSREL